MLHGAVLSGAVLHGAGLHRVVMDRAGLRARLNAATHIYANVSYCRSRTAGLLTASAHGWSRLATISRASREWIVEVKPHARKKKTIFYTKRSSPYYWGCDAALQGGVVLQTQTEGETRPCW